MTFLNFEGNRGFRTLQILIANGRSGEILIKKLRPIPTLLWKNSVFVRDILFRSPFVNGMSRTKTSFFHKSVGMGRKTWPWCWLESSGEALGKLWEALKGFWKASGCFGEVLESLWEALGRLGRLWGALGSSLGLHFGPAEGQSIYIKYINKDNLPINRGTRRPY